MTARLMRVEVIEKAHAIAYWLLPEPAAHETFSEKIHELATRFGAPEFEPHVTVFIAPENSHTPKDVLCGVRPGTIELTILGVRFSEKFTKTLFVQFEKSDALQELADRICRTSGASKRQIIDPHLSLLYANLPPGTKERVADEITLPFRTARFQSMCAMRCATPTTIQAEVRQFRLVAP